MAEVKDLNMNTLWISDSSLTPPSGIWNKIFRCCHEIPTSSAYFAEVCIDLLCRSWEHEQRHACTRSTFDRGFAETVSDGWIRQARVGLNPHCDRGKLYFAPNLSEGFTLHPRDQQFLGIDETPDTSCVLKRDSMTEGLTPKRNKMLVRWSRIAGASIDNLVPKLSIRTFLCPMTQGCNSRGI